jgi:ATP-binding cassette subfamily B protein
MGDYLLKRHEDVSWRIVNKFADVYKRAERSNLVAGSIGGLLLATAYWFVADRGVSRALTPGDLFLVMSAFASVTAYVAQISSSVVMIQEHATFLRTYFDFIELPSLLPVKDSPTRLPKSLDAGIAFEDVSFTYPKATEPALEHVNLRIRPGEMLALVGDNGAGKTTMVKLLLRLHDPDAGAIRLGGVDLRDADPGDLRGRMGVLFQDFEKYMLSVRENVQLGRVERDATDEEILEALHSARADEILKGLPNGLDSKVGRIFEGGHDLSGGEWQRLALARLMFREADVWVLDEPTSSLDAEAEAAIFAELRANLRGRMGIVISHRFSTVRIADRIAVIAGGRVTELGTHQELVDLGGRYAELFELQAAGYR